MKGKHYLETELSLLLKKNNDVFDFIQDFALDGLWLWDLEKQKNEWMNKKFWQTLGYEIGELPYSPEAWKSIIFDEDLLKITAAVQKYLKNPEGSFDEIVRYKHKQGYVVWIRCYGKLFKGIDGKHNRLLGAHQDITELKQKEFYLESSNESANIGYWEYNPDTKQMYCSKQIQYIYKTKEGNCPSLSDFILSIEKEEDKLLLLSCVNQKNEFKKFDKELRIRDFKGVIKWVRIILLKDEHSPNFFGTIQDINDNKLVEQDLYTKNEHINSIFNKMQEVVFSYELPSFKLKFITPSIQSIYGIETNKCYENPKILEEFVHPDDRDIIDKIYNDIATLGKYNEKYRIIDNNGKLKWIRNRGKVIYNNQNDIIRMDGVIIDRTKQSLSEEKLAYEESFRNLLLNIASKFIEIKLEKIPEIIQESLEKMGQFVGADRVYVFEYNFTQFTCSNSYEWCNKDINPEIENLQNIPIEAISSFYNKQENGEIISIYDVSKLNNEDELKQFLEPQEIQSIIIIPLKDSNNLFGFVGFDYVKKLHQTSKEEQQLLSLFANMLSSIHQRKLWENKLVNQEQKYRNIITNIQLGLIEINESLDIVFGNDVFKEIYGIQNQDWQNLSITKFLGKDNFGEKYNLNGELYEFKIINLKKEIKWILMSIAENVNDKGERKGFIALFIDITKQKQTQKELIKAKKKAEQAAFAKDAFLTNMSHEIRTPINIMMGIFRLLKENPKSTEVIDWIKKGENNAKYLLSIINTILDKNKIDQTGVNLEFQSFFLRDICYLIQDQFIDLASEQNNVFSIEFNCSSLELYSDPIKIQQVLVNLLSNAFKFTQNGRINLIVSEIKNHEDSVDVYFEVNDTGIGINKKFTKDIFNKFTQEANDFNINHKGSGLGLSIVKDIVDSLGSEIKLESEIGKGSKFYFSLNIKKTQISSKSNIDEIDLKSIKQKDSLKILLVDDNEMNRFIAIQSLKKINAQIWEAENGKKALNLIKTENFDLILMDIQMPIMDGVACSKHIREKLKLNTPIIAFTANEFKEDSEKYKQIGINEIIIKPYAEIELLNTIIELTQPTPLFDISFVKKLTNNNKNLINEMIGLFFTVTNEAIVNFEKSIKNNEVGELKKVVHKAKAPLRQLKIESCYDSIAFIEKFNGNLFTDELLIEAQNIITNIKKVNVELLNQGYGNK